MRENLDFGGQKALDNWMRSMSERIGRLVSESTPIADGALPDGSRINIIYSEDDIIVSYHEPSYEYYSQRNVYPLRTSHDELELLISTHNNTYLVIHEVWRSQGFRQYMFDTEQWLNETYGLTHLKTFETNLQLSLTSKLLNNLKSKAGIPSSPAIDRWDVYLIVK